MGGAPGREVPPPSSAPCPPLNLCCSLGHVAPRRHPAERKSPVSPRWRPSRSRRATFSSYPRGKPVGGSAPGSPLVSSSSQ
eukprot:4785346-Pyramimonas_sp.AAC.1